MQSRQHELISTARPGASLCSTHHYTHLPPPRQDTNVLLPLVLTAEPHNNISAACHNENQMAEAGFEAISIRLESTSEPTLRSCMTEFGLNMTPVHLHIYLTLLTESTSHET